MFHNLALNTKLILVFYIKNVLGMFNRKPKFYQIWEPCKLKLHEIDMYISKCIEVLTGNYNCTFLDICHQCGFVGQRKCVLRWIRYKPQDSCMRQESHKN